MAQGNRNGIGGEGRESRRVREGRPIDTFIDDTDPRRYAVRRSRNENPDDRHYEGTYRPEGEDYHTHGGQGSQESYRGRGQYVRDREQRRERGWDQERSGSGREGGDDYRGYDFGDPFDQRNYDSGGFGYGGTNGSGGGWGVGGNGPQTGGYGSQANYGTGYFGGPSSERDWQSGLGRDPDARYEPGVGRPRGRDHHHESYLTWRDDHVRSLDEEYEAYRAEHQAKFNEEFDHWRSRRTGKPEAKARSNPTAGGEAAERVKKGH